MVFPFMLWVRDKAPEEVGAVISKPVFSHFLDCSFKVFLFLMARNSQDEEDSIHLSSNVSGQRELPKKESNIQ